jgi:hypothetical protein
MLQAARDTLVSMMSVLRSLLLTSEHWRVHGPRSSSTSWPCGTSLTPAGLHAIAEVLKRPM